MSPCFAFGDWVYRSRCYAEVPGYERDGISVSEHLLDLSHLGPGEFSILPALRDLIGDVVEIIAKEKMLWIYASAVIASVANLLAFWNFTMMKHVRNTRGAKLFPVVRDDAIAVSIKSAAPFPAAGARLGNVRPEFIFNRLSLRFVVALGRTKAATSLADLIVLWRKRFRAMLTRARLAPNSFRSIGEGGTKTRAENGATGTKSTAATTVFQFSFCHMLIVPRKVSGVHALYH